MDFRVKIAARARFATRSSARTEAFASNLWLFAFPIDAIHLTADALDFFNRHIGDSNVECLCPYGYKGNKCETHEFLDEDNGELEESGAAFARIMQQNETFCAFLLAFRM